MYMANVENIPEVKILLERLEARMDLLPLKARFLKGISAELKAVHATGIPWKEIWRVLAEHGYGGSYQQFWRMALILNGVAPQRLRKAKNLRPPSGGKSMERGGTRSAEQPEQVNTNQEKPEWQIQREELMARLDREAEQNRQREERLRPVKIFKPSPFVGRGEE
jgi:hypothetical protein